MSADGPADFSDVAVVMITRNEERAVGRVIADARAALPGAAVFVIDGSSDQTPDVARQAGATVVAEPGGGFGPALHAALMTPREPIVVTVDADDTYPASAFPTLVRLIREGWDVVGTDRLGRRRPETMPASNWWANRIFSGLASLRARTRLRDVHSGQRAYRASVLQAFDWDYRGLAFPVDLLLWPALMGSRVTEVPIVYRERIGETTLHRWDSGRATVRRLLRSRSDVRSRHRRGSGKTAMPGGVPAFPQKATADGLGLRLRRLWDRVPSPVRRTAIAFPGAGQARKFISKRITHGNDKAFVTLSSGGDEAIEKSLARLLKAGMTGDYYEFGLYRGYTFWWAQQAALRLGNPGMRFFGFDSFEGLPEVRGADRKAGVFFSGDYRCGRAEVERNLTDHGFDWSRAALVEGYFDKSLTREIQVEHRMGTAALVMIDCDLYQSTVPVLAFIGDLLQDGAILLFDDWRAFGTSEERGEPRAFREYLAAHPEWKPTLLFDFGAYGRAFSVHRQPVTA
jgi:hypothetical protein